MDQPRVYVDLNEMVTEDIVLLSKNDTKTDSDGNIVTFYEEMPVHLYSDDASTTGETDYLLVEGIAVKYDLKEYPNWVHVKWCARIDWNSLMHESDLKFLHLLPEEIKKHPDNLRILRQCLIDFKNRGMDQEAMLNNLEKLRTGSDCETEEVLLDLMDIVLGWCNPDLSIFD